MKLLDEIKQKATETNDFSELDALLVQLNERFMAILEDWHLLTPEEQEQKNDQHLQAQYLFHEIGILIITKLMEGTSINEPDANGNEHQQMPPPTDAQPEQKEQNAGTSANDVEMNDAASECEGAVGGATEQKLVQAPYIDFCQIMDPIFSLQPINEVSEVAINRILFAITDAVGLAREKGFTIENQAYTIIAYVHRLLDVTSHSLWSWEAERENPTLDSFINFLVLRSKRISPLELAARTGQPVQMQPSTSSAAGSDDCSRPTGTVPKRAKTSCVRCKGDHFLHRCKPFKDLTLKAKLETVNRAKLCHNCFSATHTTEQCKGNPCKKCNVKHNSLLCPKNEDNEQW